ncbi:MAG: hypothetical protein ACYCSF_05345 [Acidimicrobiales bacterium]
MHVGSLRTTELAGRPARSLEEGHVRPDYVAFSARGRLGLSGIPLTQW